MNSVVWQISGRPSATAMMSETSPDDVEEALWEWTVDLWRVIVVDQLMLDSLNCHGESETKVIIL